jgi:hypothetical protein
MDANIHFAILITTYKATSPHNQKTSINIFSKFSPFLVAAYSFFNIPLTDPVFILSIHASNITSKDTS